MDDRSLWVLAGAFPSRLRTLSALLDKGAAFAAAQGVAFEELSAARLAPDMLPLSSQVGMVCRTALDSVALLTGGERPGMAGPGESLAELKARIEETVGKLEAVGEGDFRGAATRAITLSLPGDMALDFEGWELMRDWSLPHFYFHLTTAYDILRHKGVEIGKGDFVAHIGPKLRKQAG